MMSLRYTPNKEETGFVLRFDREDGKALIKPFIFDKQAEGHEVYKFLDKLTKEVNSFLAPALK